MGRVPPALKAHKPHALVEGKGRLGRIGIEIIEMPGRAIADGRNQRPSHAIPPRPLRHIKMPHPARSRMRIIRIDIPPANANKPIA